MANGRQPMRFGGKDPYPNIVFNPNVDWQDVNPALLGAIQKAAAARGATADVLSGYRSNAYSQKVGGFAGDPHTRGIAVDATVGGKPIGTAIPASVWKALGVRDGSTFNYKGAPDSNHLDLMNSTGSAPAAPASSNKAALAQSMMQGSLPQPAAPNPVQNLIQLVMANNTALMQRAQAGYQPF